KGYMIKEYFQNYALHNSDVTVDLESGRTEVHYRRAEPWRVTLVDTGEDSMTGGRLLRAKPYLEDAPLFMLTYGDGLGNVDISKLLAFHKELGRAATVTAVQPPGRFGALHFGTDHKVTSFTEKPIGDGGRISGGFFVFSQNIFKRITDDTTILEQHPLKSLAADGELAAFRHDSFWHPMDTLRDKNLLEDLWATGKAPWKLW
ncbi:MAG TPA: sugar phosphate nucleotidyltransferase, partial [Oligoflexia bacterium]|nr:sugar phosphate nucleotidyltransferase [Oligoflexia bacterium]